MSAAQSLTAHDVDCLVVGQEFVLSLFRQKTKAKRQSCLTKDKKTKSTGTRQRQIFVVRVMKRQITKFARKDAATTLPHSGTRDEKCITQKSLFIQKIICASNLNIEILHFSFICHCKGR